MTATPTGAEPSAARTCLATPPGALAWYPGERHADDLAGFHNGMLLGSTTYVEGPVGEAFRFATPGDAFVTDVTPDEQRAVRTFSYEVRARPTAAPGACTQSNNQRRDPARDHFT